MDWNVLRRVAPSLLLLGGLGGCGALILIPVFQHERAKAYRSTCQLRLKNIAMICELYMADNGKQFPLVSSKGKGWAENLEPYASADRKFEAWCPEGKNTNVPSSDFFLNARIAGLKIDKIKNPLVTIAFGEGMDNGPTNSHLSELPTHISPDEYSYSTRHLTGGNYSFADGHVK